MVNKKRITEIVTDTRSILFQYTVPNEFHHNPWVISEEFPFTEIHQYLLLEKIRYIYFMALENKETKSLEMFESIIKLDQNMMIISISDSAKKGLRKITSDKSLDDISRDIIAMLLAYDKPIKDCFEFNQLKDIKQFFTHGQVIGIITTVIDQSNDNREVFQQKINLSENDLILKTKFEEEDKFIAEELTNGTLRIIEYNGLDKVLTIPEKINGKSITEIGSNVFNSTRRKRSFDFTEVILPSSLINIGDNAFFHCLSLITINLPAGLTRIGSYSFSGCEKMKSITIPGTIVDFRPSIFSYCKSLTSVILNNGIVKTGDNMFYGCSNLTTVLLPDSLIEISNSTFQLCTSLKAIVLPNQLKIIGRFSFSEVKVMLDPDFPSSLEIIGDYAFYSCDGLRVIKMNEGLLELGINSFYNHKMISIYLPNSVNKIMKDSIYVYVSTIGTQGTRIICHPGSYAEKYAQKYKYIVETI